MGLGAKEKWGGRKMIELTFFFQVRRKYMTKWIIQVNEG